MKSTAIACAIAAGALGFGSLSHAQSFERDHRDTRQGWQASQQPPVVPEAGHRQRGDYRQQEQYRQRDQYRQHDQYRQQDQYRQYGQQGEWTARTHRFQRGDQVPYQFRQRQYYVNDWRAHRGLYAPPYGYQWVQADSGDYLLMALATGLIANLLLNQY
jgi:Ni/Co efflux regulator RcnB